MMNFFINNNNNFGQMIPVVSNNHIYYNINNSLSYINNANMNFSNQLNNNNNNYCNKNSINPKQKLNIKMECHSKMYSNKLNSTPNPTSVLCLHRLEDKLKSRTILSVVLIGIIFVLSVTLAYYIGKASYVETKNNTKSKSNKYYNHGRS